MKTPKIHSASTRLYNNAGMSFAVCKLPSQKYASGDPRGYLNLEAGTGLNFETNEVKANCKNCLKRLKSKS